MAPETKHDITRLEMTAEAPVAEAPPDIQEGPAPGSENGGDAIHFEPLNLNDINDFNAPDSPIEPAPESLAVVDDSFEAPLDPVEELQVGSPEELPPASEAEEAAPLIHVDAITQQSLKPAPEISPPPAREEIEPVAITQAQLPFNLWIEGPLAPYEKERLLEIINRSGTGIHTSDLEHQLDSGRIFLPRISEYVLIVILQALRAAKIKVRAKLATEDSETFTSKISTPDFAPQTNQIPQNNSTEPLGSTPTVSHAETLPLTEGSDLPQLPNYEVIDVITASQVVPVEWVELTNRSQQYNELIDALKLELRYRAYRKGAEALIQLKIEQLPLSLRTGYRISLRAHAIRKKL